MAANDLQRRYDAFRARGLRLDMSRGKPEPRQLDLSLPMLHATDAGFLCEDGMAGATTATPPASPEPSACLGRCWACRKAR